MTWSLTRRASLLGLAGSFAMTGHSVYAAPQANDFGVLIMAHGGGPGWNREVEIMLAPLRNDYRLEIAFGMAEVLSLQNAVRKLEEQGARRIAVIRLFISGESWYERTEKILGIRPGAQPQPAADPHAAHGEHADHDMALWRIDAKSAFALSVQGLAEAPEIGDVLVERARGLSRNPQNESVLILAHGPENDAENQRWLAQIDARAAAVRKAALFKRVQAETLREDWPPKRAESEARIRAFVEQASQDGGRALVISFRVAGFGPYKDVLQGLPYAADGKGLLPSDEVARWVRRQAEELRAGSFRAQVPA